MPLQIDMRVKADLALLRAAVSGLTAVNLAQRRAARIAGSAFAPLYETGVRYRREPIGVERWQTSDELRRSGAGDCEDLAADRAAELQDTGEDPDAFVDIVRTGRGTFHAIVRRRDGSKEDPSRILIQIEQEEGKMKPTIQLIERDGDYLGAIDMPMLDGRRLRAEGVGWSPLNALKKAAGVAKRIVNDPLLAPLVGPQVYLAVQTASALSKLSRKDLAKLIPKLGPAARKVAEGMLRPDKPGREEEYQPAPGPEYQAPEPEQAPPSDLDAAAQADAEERARQAQEQAQAEAMFAEGEIPAYIDLNDPLEVAALNAWGVGAFEHQRW